VVAVRKLPALALLALAALALAPTARAQPYKVYLLYVAEAGDSWVSKDAFASFLATHLKKAGVSFEVIKSIDDWEKLVDQAPENLIIVNCHGEVMPIPTKYGDNYTLFYQDLARNVREKGWILVLPIGLTTWLIGNEKTVGYTNVVDGPSVSAFRRALGLPPINPWCDQNAKISDLGKRVAAVLGIEIPETVGAARAIATNVTPLWYFYKVPEEAKTWEGRPFYSMAAYKVGKGMLVWGGMSGGDELRKTAITAVVVAYILDPTLAEKTPPPPPPITPQQVYMYVIAAAVVVLLIVLAVVLVKGKAPKAAAPTAEEKKQ
jgi:hypothetical protein